MPRPKRELRNILRVLGRSEERSTLFWWMLDHHDEIAAAAGGGRPRWGQLCERFAALGLKDGKGNVPSREAARRTWRHVRELVAKSTPRAPTSPKRKYPSRISPGWRPPIVQPPLSAGGAAPAAAPIGHGTEQAAEEPISEHAREQYAHLDKQIARIDAKFRF
jgi:hypothetical protein